MDEQYIDSTKQQLDAGGMRDDNINISDVIEVIETDPDFKPSTTSTKTMFNGGGEISVNPKPNMNSKRNAVLRIIEQPASKALRFRYECEGRSAGSIPGASSTPENKTFPTIKIEGYVGKAVVVVSCVTKDDVRPRPHPHNLVGRDGCKKGICTVHVPPETMTVTFSNLGIQCVKKKDIEAALRLREEIKVDPFKTGFSHRNQPTSIDLNAVRLCFQTFLESSPGKFTIPIEPVFSEVIYDKKAMCDLVIFKLSHCTCPVDGGRNDIILLCEKVAKEDIKIRFYEEKDGMLVWESYADFQPSQVHKQTAIWFKPPQYHKLDITEPVRVFLQLQRPSDSASSDPVAFEYLPLDSEPGSRIKAKRKRYKFESDTETSNMFLQFQEQEINRAVKPKYDLLNIGVDEIKTEPRDTSPSPYGNTLYGNASPMYAQNPGVSPHYQTIDPTVQTPSPANIHLNIPYEYQQPMNNQRLPSFNNVLNPNWNIPSTSTGVTAVEVTNVQNFSDITMDTSGGLGSLLDLDSQQMRQINLNSEELQMFDPGNLSENLSNSLLLTDGPTRNEQNMTDSLTRLANKTIESMFP